MGRGVTEGGRAGVGKGGQEGGRGGAGGREGGIVSKFRNCRYG